MATVLEELAENKNHLTPKEIVKRMTTETLRLSAKHQTLAAEFPRMPKDATETEMKFALAIGLTGFTSHDKRCPGC